MSNILSNWQAPMDDLRSYRVNTQRLNRQARIRENPDWNKKKVVPKQPPRKSWISKAAEGTLKFGKDVLSDTFKLLLATGGYEILKDPKKLITVMGVLGSATVPETWGFDAVALESMVSNIDAAAAEQIAGSAVHDSVLDAAGYTRAQMMARRDAAQAVLRSTGNDMIGGNVGNNFSRMAGELEDDVFQENIGRHIDDWEQTVNRNRSATGRAPYVYHRPSDTNLSGILNDGLDSLADDADALPVEEVGGEAASIVDSFASDEMSNAERNLTLSPTSAPTRTRNRLRNRRSGRSDRTLGARSAASTPGRFHNEFAVNWDPSDEVNSADYSANYSVYPPDREYDFNREDYPAVHDAADFERNFRWQRPYRRWKSVYNKKRKSTLF